MRKYFVHCCFVVMTVAGSVKAGSVDARFLQLHLNIKNNTTHSEKVHLFNVKGNWQSPWPQGVSFILLPLESYKNTLYSLKKNNEYASFTSITVSQVGSEKENYLIFSTDSSTNYGDVTGDIFDGLGSMFVASDTNYCKDTTPEGYALCTLVINSKT